MAAVEGRLKIKDSSAVCVADLSPYGGLLYRINEW